jgi:hypothetical protein
LWISLPKPYGDLICPLPPLQAEKAWWDRYEEIEYGDETRGNRENLRGPQPFDVEDAIDAFQ